MRKIVTKTVNKKDNETFTFEFHNFQIILNNFQFGWS